MQPRDGSGANWLLYNPTGDDFRVYNNIGNDVVIVNNIGNVGIGVAPSAWNSDYRAIDVGANGCIAGRVGGSNTVDIISNGFRDAAGNYVYKSAVSTPAARYLLDGSTGSHLWFSGVAGTAGNTIAGFTTAAMTLTTAGNLAFPTGKGIDFSGVTGGTGTATGNVLNDYEEGTWVPSVGGTATYTVQRGNYVKVGRLVTVSFDMEILLIGTGDISGIISLPFVVGNAGGLVNFPGYGSPGFTNLLTTNLYSLSFYTAANTSIIYSITKTSLGAGSNVNTALYGNGSRVQGSVTYMAA